MKKLFAHPKTTKAGIVVIALAAVKLLVSFFAAKGQIDGPTSELINGGIALAGGVGLVGAADGKKEEVSDDNK